MKKISFLLLATLFIYRVGAQSIGERIDSIFKPWTNDTGPGCAVAVVRDDSIVYAKGYGLGSLEYKFPIGAATPFNVASVSKQFTAFAILTLVQQDKLKLTDDIRTYLPWFPDLKATITIQHLLTHTSGIRTADQLLGIAGTRIDDIETNDDFIKVLSRQRDLNFKPGTQYGYSNSNFMLLAEIVRVVSGKTLRQYTDSVIFRPLGMTATHFHDRYNELEPGLAASYLHQGANNYSDAVCNFAVVGPASLYSSVNDLARWAMNYYAPKVGNAETIQLMTEPGRLDDGTVLKSARGIEVDHYKGRLRYAHSGSQAGYHTFFSVFPEQKLAIIVLGNIDDFKPQRSSESVADLFLPAGPAIQPPPPVNWADTGLAVIKDTMIRQFLGSYVSDDAVAFTVTIRNNKCLLVNEVGATSLLKPVNGHTYTYFGNPDATFVFGRDSKNEKIIDEYWPGRSRHFVTYDLRVKTDDELSCYTGVYFCEELDCSYRILLKDHQLFLSGYKGKDIPLKLYGDDQLTNTTWYMPNIMMLRDRQHRITGFEVDSDRVMHLPFRKVK